MQGVSISTAKDMTYTGNITVAEGAAYRFGVIQDATLTLAVDLAAGHDLVLDAQTYSGGTVVIERAQAVDGTVTVQGYDADLAHVSTGDTTLKLTTGNALASASSFMVRNGGTIDIAGTDQTMHNVTIGAGGTITDSANGGTLTIDNAVVATFAGSMDVDTIVKLGSGSLTLSGANYYNTLDVYGGILTVNNANGLAAGSITRMHNGTSITLNANVQSRIYLEGGNLTLGGSGNVSGDGAIIATGGKTSNVYLSGSTHAFAGEVGAEEGSTLRFQKPSATTTRTLALWATNINSAGGNIICDLKVNLDNGGTQTVGGTVTLAQATTWGIVTSYIGRTAGSVKNLNTVVVAGGTTQAYIYDQGVSGVWNIQHLNGGSNGSLQYTLRETSVNGANTLRFTGEGNYAGRLSYGATANSGYKGYYSVFFEIAHDKALQNVFVMPSAYNDSGNLDSTRTGQIRAAIAVNTDNARIRALGGAATAHVYAGAAAGSAKSAAPESTREATLTIGIGSGDSCTYSGSVSSNAATGNGINLVMDGLGNQAFNGANVSLLSATGLRGVLKLNSNGVTIGRDMAIAQGGTIWWGANAASGDGTFSLDAGKSFSAIASPYEVASNVSANFNGSLSLNGGTLRYESGILLNADTAMSITGTISKGAAFGDTQYVDVVDAVSLEFGHEYHLSNGDWTAVSGDEFALTPFSPYADNYINAAFSTSADGLFATFSLAENAYLWNGTDEGHAWENTSFFNTPANTPGTGDAAGTLVIQRGTTTGVIDVSGTGAILSQNSGVDSNTTNALNLFEGSELTFSSQYSGTWYINKLTGTGTLKLVQGDAKNTTDRIAHIAGAGGFAGVIESDYSRNIVRVNNHGALNGAYLDIKQGRLEMNSNNTLRGLDGGAGTSLYNGNNTSTLTINTDAGGDYTFEGSITGTTASALALVVGGEGSQTFTQDGTFRSLSQTGGGLTLGATTLVGSANLSGGTLHVTGDTTVGADFAASGTANATIDGNVTVASGVFTASQNAVVNAAGKATVSGVFTVTNEAAVSLGGADLGADVFVYASGKLAVSGDATIAGNFTMTENAVVSFTGANTSIAGDVTVTGGTLDFAGNVSLATTINSAGDITFAAGTKLYLTTDDWTEGAPDYTIITGSGSITHSLTPKDDIFINGMAFAEWRGENKRYTLINKDGNLILSLDTKPQVLTWNGTSTADVWDTTKTNTNWQGDDEPSAFTVKDTVVFAANPVQSEVTVADLGVYTGAMTVEGDGYSFSGGSVNVGGDLTLNGAETTFDSSVAVDQDLIVTGDASFNEDVAVTGNVRLEGNGKMSMQNALELTGESRLVLGGGSEAVLGGLAGEETATVTGADGSTLTLRTAEDASHEFGGSIEADAINADGSGVQKLSGTVEASSVEVSGGTLEMKGTAIVETASATGAGKLAIAEGGSLNACDGDGYITATRSGKATGDTQATLRGVELSGAGVQGINDNVEDCVIELTDLAWQGGGRTIGAVTIAANSRIGALPVANGISLYDDSPTSVVFDGTVMELTSANAALNSYANYMDTTLTNGSTVPKGAQLTSIRCTNVYADSLSGEVFLDASALQDRLTGDYVAFMFRYEGQDLWANVDPGTRIYLVLDGYKPLQGCEDTFGMATYFNMDDLEKAETKPNTPNVPEPATATLSLLALAALAARRRRRK